MEQGMHTTKQNVAWGNWSGRPHLGLPEGLRQRVHSVQEVVHAAHAHMRRQAVREGRPRNGRLRGTTAP